MSEARIEMPQYLSHKKVWALQIAKIEPAAGSHPACDGETDGGAIITPAEAEYAPFRVERDYVAKHQPKAGGYFVVYEDGYQSWSPAEAFESGYTRLR